MTREVTHSWVALYFILKHDNAYFVKVVLVE